MSHKSFLLEDIDPSINPGDDFYLYAVGSWLKRNPIPEDQSRWSAFDMLIEENFRKIREILENDIDGGQNSRKVKTFYNLGLNEKLANDLAAKPLDPYLHLIRGINNQNNLINTVAELHQLGAWPLFYFGSTPDSKNSEWVIASLHQGGLGLPEKEYYFSEDEKIKKIRDLYKEHIRKMLDLLGVNELNSAERIIAIETKLAEVSRTRVELRDPIKNYNKMNLKQLKKVAGLPWEKYFETLGLKKTDELDVGQPEFFRGLSDLFGSFQVDDWKLYLTWHLLLGTADFLGKDFEEEKFNFYGRIIQGQPKQRDRWKRVIMTTDHLIGQALGKIYVSKYFPEKAKERAKKLVEKIVESMKERITNLDWMEEQTKKEALTKLKGIKVKIGYPDWWVDYEKLKIDDSSYLAAVLSARKFEFVRDREKIGKAVNHEEWFIPPQTVNAFYNPLDNEIVFPAAILQPPFFYSEGDDALNYGGIGSVIGHEITHGFDDQGRMFDARGNLRDWWTKSDENKFKLKAENLVKQYEECVVEGERVNGRLTLGENIADLGGMTIAYEALQKELKGKEDPMIEGLPQKERFFLNYAHTYKQNIRPEKALLHLKIDPHSPDKYRVNVPLSNFTPFVEHFKITESGTMFRPPGERVVIW